MNIELSVDEALVAGVACTFAACLLTTTTGMSREARETLTRLRRSSEELMKSTSLDPTALKDLGLRIVDEAVKNGAV